MVDDCGAPLLFTSDGQVDALIPFDLTSGVTHQMLIQPQRSISLPEPGRKATPCCCTAPAWCPASPDYIQ